MTPEERERILSFLREGVPPGGFRDLFPRWKERARSFGPEAPAVYLELLRDGRADEQDGSLLALREYGYEAWAEGYGKDLVYKVRAPESEEWTVIRPVHPDEQGYRAADGRWVDHL